MADRALVIEIEVEQGDAKQALAEVDRGVAKIEQTANKTGAALSDYEQTIQKVVQAKEAATTASTALNESLVVGEGYWSRVGVAAAQAWKAVSAVGFADIRAGINGIGEGLGLTVANLGLFGTGAAIVGTAMASWEIGKRIGEWTGLTDAIQHAAGAAGDARNKLEAMSNVHTTLANASAHAGREITDLNEAIAINTAWYTQHKNDAKENLDTQNKTAAAWERYAHTLDNGGASLAGVSSATRGWVKDLVDQKTHMEDMVLLTGLTEAQIDALTAGWKADSDAVKKHGEDAKKHADKVAKAKDKEVKAYEALRAKVFEVEHGHDGLTLAMMRLDQIGEKVAIRVPTLTEEIAALGRAGDHSAASLLKLGGTLTGGGSSLTAVQYGGIATLPNVSPALQQGSPTYDVLHNLDEAKAKTDNWQSSLAHTSRALSELATVSGGTFGGVVRDIAQVTTATNAVSAGFDAIKKTGGGLLDKIAGSLSIAAGIGSVVGSIVGIVKSLTGPSKEELQSRSDRDSFMKAFGGTNGTGIQAVEDQLTQVGLNAQQAQTYVAAMLDAKTPAAFAAAMIPVNAAIEHNKQVATSVDSVTSLVSAFQNAGHVIPASMRDTLKTLAEMPGLTDAERNSLRGLVDAAKPDFETLESKAAALGISLSQLGPAFEQGDLTQRAGDFYQTIQDLINAGGDLNGILAGSSKHIGDLVTTATKAGLALPEQFKPWIKTLIDAGNFTDSAGNKITDLSTIQFAPTLQSSLDDINKSMGDLNKILHDLPTNIAIAVHADVDPNLVNFMAHKDDPGYMADGLAKRAANTAAVLGGMDPAEANVQFPVPYGFSSGGMVPSGRLLQFTPRGSDTVPAMLTPGEGVLNRGAMKRLGGAGALNRLNGGGSLDGGGNTYHVTVYADGDLNSPRARRKQARDIKAALRSQVAERRSGSAA